MKTVSEPINGHAPGITANPAQSPDKITYAHSAETAAGRALIGSIENLTGRIGLIRRASDYQADITLRHSFWQVMMERYGFSLVPSLAQPGLERMPRQGPLVVVANHPFGIADGLVFGAILDQVRGADFKIIANSVFVKAPEVEPHILPIDFAQTREALALNLATRKAAIAYLKQGGCVGIFPGGAVSTARRWWRRPFDPDWKTFTAKLIQQSNAAVVPVYFDGRNSRLFQIASHVHPSLRLSLLIREFGRQVDRPVPVVVGDPIAPALIEAHKGDAKGLMDFLRRATYGLSPRPLGEPEIGKVWD
ncbi:MAG: lysophospholipid acyltransferase family protein [Neomegalonema sp.]|nr:lysophospholipid acyltransferase family protein [Neomegalonema sp.]